MTYIANTRLRTKDGVTEEGAEIDIKNDEDAKTLLDLRLIKRKEEVAAIAVNLETKTK